MLAGMNEDLDDILSAFSASSMGATFMKFGRAPTTWKTFADLSDYPIDQTDELLGWLRPFRTSVSTSSIDNKELGGFVSQPMPEDHCSQRDS